MTQIVTPGGITLAYDDRGPPGAEPLLLVMGLGMQLIAWPEELVQMLLAQGFRVIRFDNRDAGLSQGFDELGVPNLAGVALRHLLHLPVHAPYTLADMAADTIGLLDALALPRVHLVGASLGGMVAQHVAAERPERVASLALLMTTSGARHLPQPDWSVGRLLMGAPGSHGADAVVAHLERVMRAIGTPTAPDTADRMSERLHEMVARAWRPAGTARQLVAVIADGDRRALLPRITAPTVVIHGEADPLVPVAAGRELAELIRGAHADIVPGMGHDLPLHLLPRLAGRIVANARRASAGP